MKRCRWWPVALASLALTGCWEMCGNGLVSETRSPDRNTRVVVFTRNCGGSSGYSTQVSILSVDENLDNAAGNTLAVEGFVPVRVDWKSPNQVVLSGFHSARVLKQEHQVRWVEVSYDE